MTMLGLLDRYTPRIASRVAERLFYTTPPVRLSDRARQFLYTGRRQLVPWHGGRVVTWTWGTDGPIVLLYHGWGGRASQMSAFVAPLLAAGCRVLAVDAPGHGDSPGTTSSLPAFAEALTAVSEFSGGARAIIAHSMGGAATALALRDGLDVDAAVFIGPPSDPGQFTREFAAATGLSDRTIGYMRQHVERRLGRPWTDYHVPSYAPTLSIPLLVIHDTDDREVSCAHGQAIADAWPGARLLTTHGLGHRKILRDATVIETAVRFVAPHPPATCLSCRAFVGPHQDFCQGCHLEQGLFDPALR